MMEEFIEYFIENEFENGNIKKEYELYLTKFNVKRNTGYTKDYILKKYVDLHERSGLYQIWMNTLCAYSENRENINDLEFIIRDARLQDPKNRQNSIENKDVEITKTWKEKQENLISEATNVYNWAIENGIAKEQARSVLPEGNTVSRLYMNGTLRSWIHYIELRSANGTQKEHMEIAIACAEVINKIFPMGKTLS